MIIQTRCDTGLDVVVGVERREIDRFCINEEGSTKGGVDRLDVREKWSRLRGSKSLDLHDWKDGVAIRWDKEGWGMSSLRCLYAIQVETSSK